MCYNIMEHVYVYDFYKSLGALCDLDRSASLGLLIGLLVGEHSLKDFMPKTWCYSFIYALEVCIFLYACIQGE